MGCRWLILTGGIFHVIVRHQKISPEEDIFCVFFDNLPNFDEDFSTKFVLDGFLAGHDALAG